MTEERKGAYLQTYTGIKFYPLDPKPDEICIEDLAHSLSNICRFVGHTRSFYSVAQHSVYVSQNVPKEHALWGLLHDTSEAYLSDISRPFKMSSTMNEYREAEKALEKVIAKKFDLPWPIPPSVKEADNRMLMTEKRDLLVSVEWVESYGDPYSFSISTWSPHVAEMQFLTNFYQLTGKINWGHENI